MLVPLETLARAAFIREGFSFVEFQTTDGPVFTCVRCGQTTPVDANGFAVAADIAHPADCPLIKATGSPARPWVITR